MKQLSIIGMNAIDEKVRRGADVVQFCTEDLYLSIRKLSDSAVKMITAKSAHPYLLKSVERNGTFVGVCNGVTVTVKLQATKGVVSFG